MNPKEKLKNKAILSLKDLSPEEVDLIWHIRNVYRFGMIEISTREGVPQDILKTVKRTRMGDFTGLQGLSTD